MKIALLFPGFGSQFVGMGKELYDEYRIVQEYFEEASNCLDINFVKLCFASSETDLGKMNHAYTATFLVSHAIAALMREQGVKVDVVAGYNQGDYAAICASNGINFPDGLYLLNKFASFYEAALANMQVSAIHIKGVDTAHLEAICKKVTTHEKSATIAIYESEYQHVVTGDTAAVEAARDAASTVSEKKEITIEPMGIEVELHSELMNIVAEQFKIYLEKVDFKNLLIPMVTSIDGTKIEQGDQVREYIIKRMSAPVVWTDVMNALEPYDIILQAGPGTPLADLVRERYPDKQIQALNTKSDLEAIKKMVGIAGGGKQGEGTDMQTEINSSEQKKDQD